MTIGTGIALAGAWICLGIMWNSNVVRTAPCLLLTVVVGLATIFMG